MHDGSCQIGPPVGGIQSRLTWEREESVPMVSQVLGQALVAALVFPIDLEMELLAEVTRVAWEEARPKTQKKQKR